MAGKSINDVKKRRIWANFQNLAKFAVGQNQLISGINHQKTIRKRLNGLRKSGLFVFQNFIKFGNSLGSLSGDSVQNFGVLLVIEVLFSGGNIDNSGKLSGNDNR